MADGLGDAISSTTMLPPIEVPEEPAPATPRKRVYITKPSTPPETWSPDASPYAPPGEGTAAAAAPTMPGLAEALSRSSVLPQAPAAAAPNEAPPLAQPITAQAAAPQQAEMRAYNPSPSERITSGVQDVLKAAGADNYTANNLANKLMGLVGATPLGVPIGAADTIHAKNQGDVTGTVMGMAGMVPGAKPVAKTAQSVLREVLPAAKQAIAGAAEEAVPAVVKRAAKPREAATLTDAVVAAGQRADQITKSAKLPNLREMDLPTAIEAARKEQHLGIRSADGGIEGAPANVRTRDDVLAMRDSMDRAMQLGAGVGGDKWYHEGRAFTKQAAGPDPVAQDITAKTLGLTSKQVNPDVNLGFTTKATNAYAAGRPADILMDTKQAKTYNDIRQGISPDTKKTAQLGINVNPTEPYTTTGVNDIWHARSMGYENPNGTLWTGTPSAQMHRFMDHETVLAVDRANQMKLGGRDNWTAPEVQAAIWVGRKGQSDVLKRGEANAAAIAMARRLQPDIDVTDMAKVNAALKGAPKETLGNFKGSLKPELTLADTLQEASKGYTDFAPKYTANASYEFTPGQGIAGHLQGLAYGPEGLRKKFADLPANQWTFGPNKDDALYNAAGMLQAKPTGTNQGIFSRGEGYPTEFNPGFTAHPMTAMEGDSGKRVWDQNTSDLLHGIEAIRGYFDAQNASGAHQFVENMPGRANSFIFDKSQPLNLSDLKKFEAAGAKVGKPNLMDMPDKAALTDWMGPGPGLTTKQETSLGSEIAGITGSGVKPGKRVERLSTDYNTLNRAPDWAQGEGSGAATRALMDIVNKPPALVANIDRDPRLRQMIKEKMDAHEQWAIDNNDPIRRDIQNAKEVFSRPGANGGLTGLFAALKAGKITLPALAGVSVALPMLLNRPGGAPGSAPPSADRS